MLFFFVFFFNDTAPTEIYTLSLHDALPIFGAAREEDVARGRDRDLQLEEVDDGDDDRLEQREPGKQAERSEEHTSELQSRLHLVCRLLLEKKKKQQQL